MLPIFVKRRRRFKNSKSAECLEDFSLSEHQNIRKAVLCVLPKEFCVRRSEKDPMIQGLLGGGFCQVVIERPIHHKRRPLCCKSIVALREFAEINRRIFYGEGV